MGCFGAGSKQPDSAGGSSEDTKSQKRRSDAITKQLQKDKQVINCNWSFDERPL
jgi:guanine nucleotide-binding protein G(s) subunit alpha